MEPAGTLTSLAAESESEAVTRQSMAVVKSWIVRLVGFIRGPECFFGQSRADLNTRRWRSIYRRVSLPAFDRRRIYVTAVVSLGHGVPPWLGLEPAGSCRFHRLAFYVIQIMGKESIHVIRKKRGRPPTGQDPVLAVRLPPAMRLDIENWAKQQKDRPSRSEAIRRLIEFALAAKSKKRIPGAE
jgi:hypothetical protein